jgi:hypothetical protein
MIGVVTGVPGILVLLDCWCHRAASVNETAEGAPKERQSPRGCLEHHPTEAKLNQSQSARQPLASRRSTRTNVSVLR